jgi:short-subunit dehydrogenase
VGSIVITGASSGLGRALALEYAAPGITLALIGRDKNRLLAIAEVAQKRGASVSTASLDVRDTEGMREFLLALDRQAPVDCVIANAGVSSVTSVDGEPEDLERAKEVFDINIGGVLNTIAARGAGVGPPRPARGPPGRPPPRAGNIAIVSSINAFAPTPDAASYSASKIALVNFAIATRALYRSDGVSVSLICPGFVDTPMSRALVSWKPGLLTAEVAARRIRRGLDKRRAVIAFPLFLYFLARAQQSLPLSLQGPLMMAFRAKRSVPSQISGDVSGRS